MSKNAKELAKKPSEWTEKATYIRDLYKKLDTRVRNKMLADLNLKFDISLNSLWQKFEGKREFTPVQVYSIYDFIIKNEVEYKSINNELTTIIRKCNRLD